MSEHSKPYKPRFQVTGPGVLHTASSELIKSKKTQDQVRALGQLDKSTREKAKQAR